MHMVLNLSNIVIATLFSLSSISIVNANVDIGKVKEGAKKEVVFKVKNNFKKDIRIYSVSSTCGCTIPNYPNTLKANKVTEIKAIFDSKDMKGKVKKELVLVIDDETKYYKLSFYAIVE